ncbi:hypothetical protein P0W64_21250 [Tsukamurella sp. 8F]|uniref:hypothetical protein n=1 Tax=unclassified Tsukamurella TaxID=2633480 RepID=UPI0023B93926|nr:MULTISPECIES: hypothetical protein [unclassified Tsukamurella]MDF0532285.1 hypothetical protein [Tsukamurella sp. 8J]MDF0589311.1 hypothetical protein [Tsukamurella sp. 8F]
MIEWDRIKQHNFDRVVEVLLRRRFGPDRWPGDAAVTAFDGRGGDGGRDVLVQEGRTTTIYQLKYFPEGFSSGWAKSRRPQIKESFKTALDHDPDVWVLVVPANLTPTERDFVTGLTVADAPRPRIEIVDRTALDDMLINDPDVDAWFQRDVLKENAALYNREIDSLLRPGDLTGRIRGLGQIVDRINPHWTWDFQRTGDAVICSLRARHANAHNDAPITAQIRFDTPDGSVQQAQVEKFRLYGRPLDDPVHATVTICMPEGLALGPTENLPSQVRILPADDGPADAATSIIIDLLDSAGTKIASRTFTVRRIGISADGYGGALHGVDSAGVVHFEALHRSRTDDSMLIDGGFRFYSTPIAGKFPDEVLDSLEFLAELTRAATLQVSPARGSVDAAGTVQMQVPDDADFASDARFLATYVRALNIVQQKVPRGLRIPAELAPDEVATVRLAATLLDKKKVDLVWTEFDVVLWPNLNPATLDVLNNEHGFQLLQTLALEVTVGGITHEIGAYTRIFHRALNAGQSIDEQGRQVVHVVAHPDNDTITAYFGLPAPERPPEPRSQLDPGDNGLD